MSKKPVMPVMLDLETLAIHPLAAVIDIAIGKIDDGILADRWLITPESYTDSFCFHVDQETIAFHNKQNTGLMKQAAVTGQPWQQVAEYVFNYLQNIAQGAELHIWCQGKDFDIPILANLLTQAGYKLPWKYSHTHCLRDLAKLYPEIKRTSWGNHTASLDVFHQVKHLMALASYDDRVYRMVFGE